MIPTRDEIATWLVEQHAPAEWASFLDGLPWEIIRSGVKIARASKTHPAMALGAAAVYSGDPQVQATIRAHLDRHAPPGSSTPAGGNRATRRAAARSRRETG